MADQPLHADDAARAKLSAGDSDRRCVLDLLKAQVGCGFNYCLFLPLLGEMIRFDSTDIFQTG